VRWFMVSVPSSCLDLNWSYNYVHAYMHAFAGTPCLIPLHTVYSFVLLTRARDARILNFLTIKEYTNPCVCVCMRACMHTYTYAHIQANDLDACMYIIYIHAYIHTYVYTFAYVIVWMVMRS
jgi:hypothetical protein